MSVPLTPNLLREEHAKSLPAYVIDSVNHLLKKKYNQSLYITISQDAIVNEIMTRGGVERQTIFDENMLEIEYAYKQFGWKVSYDSETKYFTFAQKAMEG